MSSFDVFVLGNAEFLAVNDCEILLSPVEMRLMEIRVSAKQKHTQILFVDTTLVQISPTIEQAMLHRLILC